MQLTENFSLNEFVRSQVASRKGIDNNPPLGAISNLRTLCINVLQPLRKQINSPIIITSGFRSLALNTAIGGAENSQHLYGEAADIECLALSNYQLAEHIVRNLDTDQTILEFHTRGDPDSGWVHVSFKSDRENRGDVFTAVQENGKLRYLKGLIA